MLTTSKPTVIDSLAQLQALRFSDLAPRREPDKALMCTPDHFRVIDVKNPYMEGNAGAIDLAKAQAQWEALKATFEQLGYPVEVIPGAEGCEDMVFAANQTLPGLDAEEQPYVLLSNMRHPSRQQEVAHYRAWFEARGYRIMTLPNAEMLLEGQGDALWHPSKKLIWGGYGHRTDRSTYDVVSQMLGVPVVALKLVTDKFYHLDTCLSLIDETTAMAVPGAFDAEGIAMLRAAFPKLIEIPESEALECFAGNALALGGRHVVMHPGATETVARLRAHGLDVIEVDTSEYMKSGGSVFCMKMMIY